jgi:hypothetical protein
MNLMQPVTASQFDPPTSAKIAAPLTNQKTRRFWAVIHADLMVNGSVDY